jgi:hypothetical protein
MPDHVAKIHHPDMPAEDIISLGQNSTVEVAPEHGSSATTRVKGISLCLVGVLCISPDGALLEQQGFWGVNNWVAILYRCSFAFCFSTVLATVIQGGPCQTVKALQERMNWRYILLQGAADAACDVLMSVAFLWTSVPKAVCLFALNPIWALLAARCWESQPVTTAQIMAVLSLAVSVILVFMPNIGGFAAANPQWQNSALAPLGDVAAVISGMCFTLTMMISVAASKAGIPMTAMSNSVPVGNGISSIFMLVICAISGIIPLPNPTYVSKTSSIAVALLNGGFLTVFSIVAVVAPWYVSTLDASLVFLLEVPFSPLIA